MVSNDQFMHLMKHYHSTFIKWHLHITKYIRIDRESFLSEFQLVLFNSMLLFDINKATAQNARFERYFMSSLRNRCNTLLRKASSKKRIKAKKYESLNARKHNIAEINTEKRFQEIVVNDLLKQYLSDSDTMLIEMLADGQSGSEICDEMNINRLEYRSRLRKIRHNQYLIEAVSSV